MPIKNGESCVLGPPVNGILVAKDAHDGSKGSSFCLYIGFGKMMQLGTNFFGLIDDVRIYKRIVSPKQIEAFLDLDRLNSYIIAKEISNRRL